MDVPSDASLWKKHFHWTVLLRWEVLGWILAFLPAVGGLLLFFDQYGWANTCFIATAAFVFAKIAEVAISSTDAWWHRMIFTFVLFGLVGIAIVESVRGVNRWSIKHSGLPVVSPTAPAAPSAAASSLPKIGSQQHFPTAAEIAEEIRKEQQTNNADLKYLFFGKDALRFSYKNESKVSGQQPKYWFLMLDLSRPYFPNGDLTMPNAIPIPTVVQSRDFVRPGDMQENIEVLGTSPAKGHVQYGDKLLAIGWITCANCVKTRAYYVYFEVGVGGWYAPVPDAKKLEFPKPMTKAASDTEIKDYLDKLVPPVSRTPIPETLS
jgi:hypothetical protein